MESRRRRVPALAPEERRAALIAATIPLLHEHGLEVSTRQIASAAGVAEGTIFGVFESKSKLVICSVIKALDPQPTLDALAAIDPAAELRVRVAVAAELVHARFAEHAHLMSAARKLIFAGHPEPEAQERMAAARHQVHAAVTAVFAPDAGRLRIPAEKAAQLVLLHCGAHAFGPFGEPDSFNGAALASLLLDGIVDDGSGPVPDVAAEVHHELARIRTEPANAQCTNPGPTSTGSTSPGPNSTGPTSTDSTSSGPTSPETASPETAGPETAGPRTAGPRTAGTEPIGTQDERGDQSTC